MQALTTHNPAGNPEGATLMALTQLKRGQTAVVTSASLHHDDEAMLAAMGLRTEARVQVCRSGQPCIVRVMGECGFGCRIGLARPIASQIVVRPDAARAIGVKADATDPGSPKRVAGPERA